MALTLSNSGISSGSVINAAQISQSIDAFTGAEAYNITLSGSFTMKGDQQITSDPGGTGSLTVVGIQVMSASLSHGVGLVLTGSMTQAEGEIKMDKLIVSSSENILGVFDSTDDAAKIVLKDSNGEGARFSYVGSEDTVGIGQSNIHNSMSIHIDNDENVAIGALHFTPNAVLDVSGSFLVSGSSFMSGSITASGDISSSATVYGLTGSFGTSTTTITDNIETTGNISASGHISASELNVGGGTFTSASLASGGGGTPAGSDGQVQYNDNGAFGATNKFSFNDTTNTLSINTASLSTGYRIGTYDVFAVSSEITHNVENESFSTKIIGFDGDGFYHLQNNGHHHISASVISMSGHLIPTANDVFDIGNAEKKIRDIYISDSSIYMGTTNGMTASWDGTNFNVNSNSLVRSAVTSSMSVGSAIGRYSTRSDVTSNTVANLQFYAGSAQLVAGTVEITAFSSQLSGKSLGTDLFITATFSGTAGDLPIAISLSSGNITITSEGHTGDVNYTIMFV